MVGSCFVTVMVVESVAWFPSESTIVYTSVCGPGPSCTVSPGLYGVGMPSTRMVMVHAGFPQLDAAGGGSCTDAPVVLVAVTVWAGGAAIVGGAPGTVQA